MSMNHRFETFSRRDLFRIAAASLGGLSCSPWLPQLAQAADALRAGGKRPPKACILLWMAGGPSQMETLDPKPGHKNGGPTKAIQTSVPGIHLSENLPDTWGPQPERVAAKFWRNMVYWATEGASTGRRRLVAESDKRFYRPGEPLSVFATAYDEGARRTQKYRVWAMFEPASLDDMSLYSPILWPDNIVRDSGEVGPRIAWGEELPLVKDVNRDGYRMNMMLSETSGVGDSGLRIEMTAYEGAESNSAFDHGTQVDSTSLAIQVLSDPFEQQNPLPNHELLKRLAAVSGGQVLEYADDLADLLKNRKQTLGPPLREVSPAWSDWWLWLCLLGLLTSEWIWRRVTGLA